MHINSCLHFLFGLFVCFCCLFYLVFYPYNICTVVVADFRRPQFPVSCSSLCFLPTFFLYLLAFIHLASCCASHSVFLFFSKVFFYYFLLFSRFLVSDHFFLTTVYLFFVTFFFVVSCALFACDAKHVYGSPASPFAPPKNPYMICGGHVVTASLIVRHLAPPHVCHNYAMSPPRNHSFCLGLRLLRTCASPRTHPDPSSPS